MINPRQLQGYVVNPVLNHLAPQIPYSADAENLLMGTAAQESDCGTYLHQLGGPALGVWQMEPATAADHFAWLATPSQRALNSKVCDFVMYNPSMTRTDQLIGNLMLACAMARIHYWRAPGPIPSTIEGQAGYWKRWYNTEAGAGTVAQYLANWEKVK